ncbi:MAG: sensor histidine kinase [Thermoflexales bacterium]|nr:sensor histidine kinase [Thermoflexales bacterium]
MSNRFVPPDWRLRFNAGLVYNGGMKGLCELVDKSGLGLLGWGIVTLGLAVVGALSGSSLFTWLSVAALSVLLIAGGLMAARSGRQQQRERVLARRVEHKVIVQERERISREIHDGLAQALALLNMRVNVAQNLLEAGQVEQVGKELAEAARLIDAANHDVREAITALRLTSPKGVNFVPMLEEFVLDFGLRNDVQTEFIAMNGSSSVVLNPLIEVQLMRIIQEALTNVRKHAHAHHAQVTLDRRPSYLQVVVRDNGQGFDMDAVLQGQNRQNFGITTMHERVEAIGGSLDIVTLLGSGTSVTVSVPVELQEGKKGVDSKGPGL